MDSSDSGEDTIAEVIKKADKNENKRKSMRRKLGNEHDINPSRPYCELCKKSFALRGGLRKHLRKQHAVVTGDKTKLCDCYHEECRNNGIRFRNSAEYRVHLEEYHGVKGITVGEELVFDTFEQVQTWKAEQERKDMSKFVQFCSVTKTKTSLAWRYRCNRSGSYTSQSSGKRRTKRQGSCKSGHRCPATLIVVLKDNHYHVTYHSMHYGHEKMLCHLNLGPADRQRIAGLLAQGVSDEEILLSIRQSGGSEFNRSHLITRKDLNNIRRAYGIRTVEVEKEKPPPVVIDDSLGIHNWIQEMKNLGPDNPVLVYKPKGEIAAGFNADDFLLIIMNPLQRKILQKFGHDRICIDSTYNTPGHEFELTTILVVDDYEEGFPVAFMCSSMATSENIMIFFNCIKTTVGIINTSCFICDDIPAMYHNWSSVMGSVDKRMSYTQHVEKATRERSDGLVVNCGEMRQAVHRALRSCHTELRDIKSKYVLSGISKKIDKCIDALFSFILNKQFNRLTKLHKGKLSTKLANMVQCHMEGETLVCSCVPLDSNRWLIHSGATYRAFQVNRTEDHQCNDACNVVCRLCKCCLSNMACTCDDYQVHGNMCKHMHAACIFVCKSTSDSKMGADEIISCEVNDETQFYLSTLRANCKPHKYETILKFTQEIESLTTCELEIEGRALAEITTHLRAARDVLLKERDRRFVRGFLNSKGTIENNVYTPSRRRSRMSVNTKSEPQSMTSTSEVVQSSSLQELNGSSLFGKQLLLASEIIPTGNTQSTVANMSQTFQAGDENITIMELAPIAQSNVSMVSVNETSIFVTSAARPETSLTLVLEAVSQVRLSMKDQLAIANSEPLTDTHIDFALQLLRNQFSSILGLESVKLHQIAGRFTSQPSKASVIVQIHNAGPGRWITTTRGCGEDFVTVYDSLLTIDVLGKPQLEKEVKLQITQLYHSPAKQIDLVFPQNLQPLSVADCGLYAIATATDICYGNQPFERSYNNVELRTHLFNCFQQQRLEPFPAAISGNTNMYTAAIPVYCVCRSLGDNTMVRCWQCCELFHCRCVNYKGGEFRCDACCKISGLPSIL